MLFRSVYKISDETCVAIRSQYARAVTFYNPKKSKGKHHLKFYTLRENSHCYATVTDSDNNMSKDMFDDLYEIEDKNIPNLQMDNNNANHGQSQCEKVAPKNSSDGDKFV